MTAASVHWQDLVTVHPATNLFPMLNEASLDELAADIGTNGLRVRIVIWRANDQAPWQLVDGRNRLAAMARLADGETRTKEALEQAQRYGADVDPVYLVVSLNLTRRHLTAKQKRELIAQLLKLNPATSNRTIAKLVGADDKTVGAVRAQAEAGAEIPHVTTRTDTRGRSQPAAKPARPRSRVAGSAAAFQPIFTQQRPSRMANRNDAVVNLSALFERNMKEGIEDVLRMLGDEKKRIDQIPLPVREKLVADFAAILGVENSKLAGGAT
jgi:hypothetical protein